MKIDRHLVEALNDLLARAFAEDGEDITTLAVFGPKARVAGDLVCREAAVVAGAAFLPRVFAFPHPPASVEVLVEDGVRVAPGTVLARVEGPAISVLAAERTALNLVQRLTGVATATRAYVDALEGTAARLLDTRKTTPGLRVFEKYAVRCGGGTNHRMGLSDAFLVKDNHADGCGSLWDATRRATDFRAMNRSLKRCLLEAEARTRDEVHQALEAGSRADPPGQHDGRGDEEGRRRRRALERGDRRLRVDRGLGRHDRGEGAEVGPRRRRLRLGGSSHALRPGRRHRPRREGRRGTAEPEVSPAAGRIRVPALVIGTGIAGLTAALALAKRGVRVLLLTKADDPGDCNTAWAQGGIIYFGRKDSPASLVKDILAAGAGLCNAEAVRFLAQEGPRVVEEILIGDAGVPFSRTREGDLDFTREGAHSVARIVHSADATGKAIEIALLARVKAEKSVKIWTGATAIDLITARHHSTDVQQRYALQDPCLGAYVLDASGSVHTVLADFTILATGGVGRLFLHTTNTRHAIGDGLTMAARAGAAVLNLEYVQFHPTTLYHPDGDRFLISEALRGEGAVLVNRSGKAFMHRYDRERKDLAPRDVVTRAIVEEMTTRGEPCVYLDLAHNYEGKGKVAIRDRFPTIAATCAKFGIDIATEPIPVVPAAHYFCGGVLADLEGKTTIRNLYAVGETSCTGLHGANRLASTSLLEGLVWGAHAARSIADRIEKGHTFAPSMFRAIPDWKAPGDAHNEDPALIQQDWTTIRNTMWNYVGIVRTGERLGRAVADIRDLEKRLSRFYHETKISREIVDLIHGVHASHLIAQAALKNPVSRGCHYRRN